MDKASALTVGAADFDVEVLERSHTTPVLVDFWAPWCAPCRALAPVLERLVGEFGDDLVLAKVNTEDHPAVAQRYGIRGIPAVKLFRDGRVVDEFVGNLPPSDIRRFLRVAIPSATDRRIQAAIELREGGQVDAARQEITRALEQEPLHVGALLEAARTALMVRDVVAVEEHVAAIDPSAPEFEAAQQLLNAARLVEQCKGGRSEWESRVQQSPDDVAAWYTVGCCRLADGHQREALEAFLEVVQRDRKFRDGAAQRAMVALFDLFGRKTDLVDEYVRKLQIYG